MLCIGLNGGSVVAATETKANGRSNGSGVFTS